MISRFPTLSRSSEVIRIDIFYYQHFHRDSEHYRSSELHDEGKAIIVNYILVMHMMGYLKHNSNSK